MIEIKAEGNAVMQKIKGKPLDVLSETVLIVRAVVQSVMRDLRTNGIDESCILELQNAMTLAVTDAIHNGVTDSKEEHHDG